MCLSVCGYVHTSSGAYGVQKGAPDTLDLELQVVVSWLVWVLGTEPPSSARAVCNLLAAEPSLRPRDLIFSYVVRTHFL